MSEPETATRDTEPAQDGWHILVVDDEADVRAATRLAVKRKTWHKKPFILSDVASAKQARELLESGDYRNKLQVALVDVVMETQYAGLDLCRYIRAELPRSVRIILRTGQPGVAPEERVINDYDIDFYFAKTEATADRLYMALRTCLRSSQDIETLLAFGDQMRAFTTSLQKVKTRADLTRFMRASIRFLEVKHSAQIAFVSDLDSKTDVVQPKEGNTLAKAFDIGLAEQKLHAATDVGLDDQSFVMIFTTAADGVERRGGFVVQTPTANPHDLQSDLALFEQNWTVALASVFAQARIAEVGELNELMYVDRLGGLSTVLAGAGRRIEGSIAAAAATGQALRSIGDDVTKALAAPAAAARDKHIAGLVAQMRQGLASVDQDLETAKALVKSFSHVSATQLRDDRVPVDLVAFVRDCVDLVGESDRATVRVTCLQESLPWTGYPGSLAHVLIKLIESAMRHAYDDDMEPGSIDVRLFDADTEYRIEVEDYGKGTVPRDVLVRLANPVQTTVPNMVGVKMAVAHNIVTQRLSGRMSGVSTPGVGSKFLIHLPREVAAIRGSGRLRV